MSKPRALFVDGLVGLDAAATRKWLALAMAAVRVASIEAGGDGALLSTLHRVEALLAATARQSIKDLALALDEHEAKKATPPDPAPPPGGIRLPRIPLRTPPRHTA